MKIVIDLPDEVYEEFKAGRPSMKNEYIDGILEHFKLLAKELAAMASADSALDFDSACIHLLDKLNDFSDFIQQNNPNVKK